LADKNYLVPRADAGLEYVEAIKTVAHRESVDLVIPNNDAEVGVLSPCRDDLGAKVFLPSMESIAVCQDKLALNKHLHDQGIRVAETHSLDGLGQIDEVYGRFHSPDMLWCRMRRGSASKGSLPVRSPDQIRFWVQYWHEMRDTPLDGFILCEYLPGRDFAFQSLWHEGQLVIAKTCERLSYLAGAWMPSGTSSTPRVGRLVNDARVNSICVQAIRSLDPQANGMFCVDLKEAREGTPCITEINIGRFFTINPAFNAVGRHNMADLFIRLSFGETVAVHDSERFSDIGTEETFLVRELDNEPSVHTAGQIEEKYVSILQQTGQRQGPGVSVT
jgi:carbamoyl-phosphate synthase large subunit